MKTRWQVAERTHQKREPRTFSNKEEANKGKESTWRNAIVVHQPHVLHQKAIHLKKKWKRASKNRKKYSSKKSLSSSNESDTKTYLDTEPFKVISEADKYQYNFPAKMVKYATEQFHSYMKNTDIK